MIINMQEKHWKRISAHLIYECSATVDIRIIFPFFFYILLGDWEKKPNIPANASIMSLGIRFGCALKCVQHACNISANRNNSALCGNCILLNITHILLLLLILHDVPYTKCIALHWRLRQMYPNWRHSTFIRQFGRHLYYLCGSWLLYFTTIICLNK